MNGLSTAQRRALAAWREHPEVGLVVVGDAHRRVSVLRAAAHALGERRTVAWQAASTPLNRIGTAAVCVAAGDALDAESAVLVADAAAPLLSAPALSELHPKLASRCTVVLDVGHDPELSADLILAATNPRNHTPLPPLPPPSGSVQAADVVALLTAFGVVDHRIDVGAGLVASALSGLAPQEIDEVLVECVALPRATRVPAAAPEPPPGAEDTEPSESDDAARECEEERSTSPQPDTRRAPDDEPAEPTEDAAAQENADAELPSPTPLQGAPTRARALQHAPAGRRGGTLQPAVHGRAARVVTSERPRAHLTVVASLREAARWARPGEPVRIRREHLRWAYRRRSSGRLTIFVVDVSGSVARDAVRRAKGMALAMLDTAYQRRDRIAMVLVRGAEASIGIHPTRSSARARAAVRRLPVGGGTPLASGLLEAARLARAYDPPAVEAVVFTDGRANVALAGSAPGRAAARADAERAAALLRERVGRLEIVDTSRRGHDADWLRPAVR